VNAAGGRFRQCRLQLVPTQTPASTPRHVGGYQSDRMAAICRGRAWLSWTSPRMYRLRHVRPEGLLLETTKATDQPACRIGDGATAAMSRSRSAAPPAPSRQYLLASMRRIPRESSSRANSCPGFSPSSGGMGHSLTSRTRSSTSPVTLHYPLPLQRASARWAERSGDAASRPVRRVSRLPRQPVRVTRDKLIVLIAPHGRGGGLIDARLPALLSSI
jgi:hypothetical protein